MDYPHFSVNFVNFGIHKLSTLIKMGLHSCVKKEREQAGERAPDGVRLRAGAGGPRRAVEQQTGFPALLPAPAYPRGQHPLHPRPGTRAGAASFPG